jgi:hypothetical protein
VRTIWGIRYIKRKFQERRAKYEAQSSEEKAAWRTANATLWISFFTIILTLVGCLTLYEVISGGSDTHALLEATQRLAKAASGQLGVTRRIAEAAKAQSDSTRTISEKAIAQAQATNDLAKAAKRSADIAQRQQTPWLGIEQPDSVPITFYYLWNAPLPFPTIGLDLRFLAKNYGLSPAHLLAYGILNLNLDITPENDDKSIRQTCRIDMYRASGQVQLPKDSGESLLPGDHRPFNGGEVTTFAEKTPREFTTLSFTICLIYQDTGQYWHYSGYRYRAFGTRAIQVPDHTGWSYTQFTGATLLASYAE